MIGIENENNNKHATVESTAKLGTTPVVFLPFELACLVARATTQQESDVSDLNVNAQTIYSVGVVHVPAATRLCCKYIDYF